MPVPGSAVMQQHAEARRQRELAAITAAVDEDAAVEAAISFAREESSIAAAPDEVAAAAEDPPVPPIKGEARSLSTLSRFSDTNVTPPSTNHSSANNESTTVNKSNNPSLDGSFCDHSKPPGDYAFGGNSREWRVEQALMEEDGSPVCFDASDAADAIPDAVDELRAIEGSVNPPNAVQPQVFTLSDNSDDDSSSIIAWSASDSVSETSLLLNDDHANLWASEVIRDLMRPSTEDELQAIACAFKPGPPDEVMVTMGSDSVQRQSIHRLRPGIWLNDEVINLSNKQLAAKAFARLCKAVTGRKHSYVMGTYFLQTYMDLKNTDPTKQGKPKYDNVRKWAKKVKVVHGDLFELAFLHFPYNKDESHWTLVSVSFPHKLVVYYDSFHGDDHDGVANAVFEYLKCHYKDVHGEDLDIKKWKVITKPTGNEFTRHYSSYPFQVNSKLFLSLLCLPYTVFQHTATLQVTIAGCSSSCSSYSLLLDFRLCSLNKICTKSEGDFSLVSLTKSH